MPPGEPDFNTQACVTHIWPVKPRHTLHRLRPVEVDSEINHMNGNPAYQPKNKTAKPTGKKSGAAHRSASAKNGTDFVDAVARKNCELVCHSQTITVSLIGRMDPERRLLLDKFCRYISSTAQLASRLALFVVERRLNNNMDVGQLLSDNTRGGLFIRDCLNICSGLRASKVVQEEEMDAFGQLIDIPTTRDVVCSNAILVRRDEMWKAMRKHMEICAQTKVTLWIRHMLRREGVLDALVANGMTLPDAKTALFKVADQILDGSRPWNVPEHVVPQVDSISRVVNETFQPLEQIGKELHEAKRTRLQNKQNNENKTKDAAPTNTELKPPKSFVAYALQNGEAYQCLPLMQKINNDFARDRVAKRMACQENPGRSKDAKKARSRAIRKLPLWQQMVPATFNLLPLKVAGEVDFQFVSRTVGAEILSYMLKQEMCDLLAQQAAALSDVEIIAQQFSTVPEEVGADMLENQRLQRRLKATNKEELAHLRIKQASCRELAQDPRFWWKQLLQLDNIDHGDRFRSVGIRRKRARNNANARPDSLARISGLCTSISEKGLILTGFRTNARELHLVTERDKRTTKSPALAVVMTPSTRGHGYDVLAQKGFRGLTPQEDNVVPTSALMDLAGEFGGIYGACKAGQEARCVVVDPGQINPMSWGIANLGGMTAGINNLQTEVGLVTGHVDKATFGAERNSTAARTREKQNRCRTRWYPLYIRRLAEAQLLPSGLERLQQRLKIESFYWHRNAVLRGGTKVTADGRIIMLSRDHSFKQKRCRIAYARQKALEWRDIDNAKFIGFGDGRCRARGHVATPTKQMIRNMAPILPVVVLPEWGTSSRCPNCQSGIKMESRIMETLPSAEIPGDNRYEHCVQCNTDWEHDGVSIINLCWVANDMLKNGHGSRPAWLKRVQI